LMEAVPDDVRARVFGFWITIGGLVGNTAHWLAGWWVEALGPRANAPDGYFSIYAALAILLCLSTIGLPCLRTIHRREQREKTDDELPATNATAAMRE
jgi:MFS family permease